MSSLSSVGRTFLIFGTPFINRIISVGLHLLGYIDRRLKAIFNTGDPFGERTVLLMGKIPWEKFNSQLINQLIPGDMAQLRAVRDHAIFYRCLEPSGMTLDGMKAFGYFQHCFILTEIMRQGPEEAEFKDLLSRIRVGELTNAGTKLLESRHIGRLSDEELPQFLGAPYLFGDNHYADTYNE